MRVAMHEFKAGLSRYVARAQAGEVFELTSHDKPVARLVGIPARLEPGLARLMASGAVHWSGGKPGCHPPVTLTPGGKSVSEMVIEDRG